MEHSFQPWQTTLLYFWYKGWLVTGQIGFYSYTTLFLYNKQTIQKILVSSLVVFLNFFFSPNLIDFLIFGNFEMIWKVE